MVSGVLNAFKPKGPTSHDVVDEIRRKTGVKKVGHAGTLDPFARGVLIVGVGRRATRVLDLLKNKRKIYSVKMRLGIITETFDITGKVVEENECDVDFETLKTAVEKFVGEYDQVPPAYSARKYKGKKLYELARDGKIIRLPPKRVKIYRIWDLSYDFPYVSFRVETSPGTYVRSLCMDIGYELGCGATAVELIRESVGEFRIENSLNPFEASSKDIEKNLIPIERVLEDLPGISVKDEAVEKVLNGSHIRTSYVDEIFGNFGKGETLRILNNGKIIALAKSERTSSFLNTLIKMGRDERIAKLEKVLGESS